MVHFLWQNWKNTIFLRVRVKYRITDFFLLFCIFGDRDEDSMVGITQKNILISYNEAILSLSGASYMVSMLDPKDLLCNLIDVQ